MIKKSSCFIIVDIRLFLIVLSLVYFTACSFIFSSDISIDSNDLNKVELTPGIQKLKATMSNGQTLYYSLSIPDNIDSAKVPLVIALHYAGNVGPYFSEPYLRYLVNPGLSELKAIIFAPDVPFNRWTDIKSEDMIISFIKNAINIWPIDQDKIVITGYSMGGMGTWHIADKYSWLFCAAIPMAAKPIGTLSGEIPHYVIHSKKDNIFDFRNVEKVVESMQSRGAVVKLNIVDHLTHEMAFEYVDYLKEGAEWIKENVWHR